MNILKPVVRVFLLLVMLVLGFTIVMPGWYHQFDIIKDEVSIRFKDNSELIEYEARKRKQKELTELARIHNMSEQEYAQLEFDSKIKGQQYHMLTQLAKTNKSDGLVSLLSITSDKNIPVSIFADAINSKSRDAFQALLSADVSCDYATPKGGQAFRASINSTDPWYFQQLVASRCKRVSGEYHKPIAEILLARKKFDLMLELPVQSHNQHYFDRSFEWLLNNKQADQAMAFLQHGVSEQQIERSLIKAARAGLLPLAHAILRKGGDFAVPKRSGLRGSVLNAGLQQEDMSLAKAILQKDAQYITRETLGHDSLFYSAARFANKTERQKAMTFLFDNGLDYKRFPRQGLFALMEMIKLSRPQELQLLIDQGANPKVIYHSKSLIEIAEERNGESKQELIAILENVGVPRNALELVKQDAQYKEGRQCDFQTLEFDFSAAEKNIINSFPEGEALSAMQRCEALVLSCTKTRAGLDACIHSAPTCRANSEKGAEPFCCDAAFKTTYAEARCAGLPSVIAVSRIPGLSTQYNIPLIIINEAELERGRKSQELHFKPDPKPSPITSPNHDGR